MTDAKTPVPVQTATLPFRHRLGVAVMLFAALLVIIPAAILNRATFTTLRNAFQQQTFNQLAAINGLKKDQLEYWLANDVAEQMEQMVELNGAIIKNWLARGDFTTYTNVNRALKNALRNYDSYLLFFVYDDTGRVLTASDDAYRGRVVHRQPYFANSFVAAKLTPPYYEVGSGELVMFFTYPLLDKWVIAGQLNLAHLQETVAKQTGLGETGETYLISLDNHYLLTPLRDTALPLNRAYRSLGIEEGLNGKTGSAEYVAYDDDPVFGAFTWLPELNAALITELHVDEATAIFNQVRIEFVGLSVGLAALSLVVAFFAARLVTRPIANLTRAAQHIAAGNLDIRTNIKGQNEIAQLGQSFNIMTDKLRLSMQEIGQRETRLRSLIEALPIGMITYHVEKTGQTTLDDINPAAKTLLPSVPTAGTQVDAAHCDLVGMDSLHRYQSVAVDGQPWQASRVNQANGTIQSAYELYAFQTASQQMALAFLDTTDQRRGQLDREKLQQQIIEAQKHAIAELSTPIIPLLEGIIILPLIGSVDSARAQDILRALLKGISDYRARIVILDITGVPVVDSGVANHLNKTIQAARLKGTHTIITGISDAVAETIVDLGIDWSNIETLRDLQSGLIIALERSGLALRQHKIS
jgi:anti-anti-sigma regulatory factor/HAMP domain-containing protein